MASLLIDKFMPMYDFNEIHSITIRASPSEVFEAIKSLTPSELSFWVHFLLAMRTLPTRLTSKDRGIIQNDKPILEQIISVSFLHLAEERGAEVVVGTIGQFWRLRGGSERKPAKTPQEFLAFSEPGYAKSVMNFHLVKEEDAVRVVTETRIQALDTSARRRFAFYWKLVYPGSALIRVLWLRAVKRRAENKKSLSV